MADLWRKCVTELKKQLPAQQINTWVKPLKARVEGSQFQLIAPNHHVLRWAKANLADTVGRILRDSGQTLSIDFVLETDAASEPEAPTDLPSAVPAPATVASPRRSPEEHRLNPSFTFASFVSGKANQMAHAAADQVAQNTGAAYNPLFIYGATGLGKTHLLHAIGWQLLARSPAARVRYIHTEQFVEDVVAAYRNKAFDTLKRRYRTLDLLLIDDVQFFIDKPSCQEEFFYTFNALFEANKQVVLTSDAFPREIQGIEERLKSRFGWGLTVAVEPPELEMRVAILLNKAASEGVRLDDSVAFFIAQNVRSNVRELEGALKRVLAFARFKQIPVTLDSTKEALQDLLAVVSRQVSIDNIQRTVADYFKIKVSDMYSKKRFRSVARPRQVAMALAKELTQQSLPEIGEAFGGRDHTTVLHACRKTVELRNSDHTFARDYQQLQQILQR